MIPIITASYPRNGTKDMELNSPIKITFADALDAASITSDNIKLENLNDGRDIPLSFIYNAGTFEIQITPSDNQYGNMLLGLTKYRLSASNISSPTGELMQGLATLEFTTVSDSIEDVAQPPVEVPTEFALVNFYPKQGSYGISPDVVKVKFNKDVLLASVTRDTFQVTTDTIEDINDIGFISIDVVTGEYDVSGGVVSFKPYAEYTEDVGTGATLTGGTLRSSFQLPRSPVYSAVIRVADVEVVKDTDYTLDMNTGALTFIAGHEPANGAAITAVIRQYTRLTNNTKYTVIISGIQSTQVPAETIETTLYTFYTAFSPLYATLKDIETNYASLAAIIEGMDVVDILEIVRQNSEGAYWVAQQADNQDNITWDPPEKIVVEYVKAKTRYDIVFDKYVGLASDATSKTLGDLTIQYSMSLSDLLSLAEKLKLAYQYWENMLRGSASGRPTPQPFVKGENVDEVPAYKDRSLKDWSGNKSW